MRAVITAGGPIDGAYAAAAGTRVKALAPVRGETMLARAVRAARGAGAREIAVVGGEAVRTVCERDVERVVSAAESGSENVLRALTVWPDNDTLLYMTSDLPYVESSALADFVARSGNALTIPLTPCEAFTRRFPGAAGFGIRIGRECVVNGGAFHLPPGTAPGVCAWAQRLFDARKHPLQMARLAGIDLLVRFVLRRLSVESLEGRARRVLGVQMRAVRDCAPELAYDADDAAAYRYACEHA